MEIKRKSWKPMSKKKHIRPCYTAEMYNGKVSNLLP